MGDILVLTVVSGVLTRHQCGQAGCLTAHECDCANFILLCILSVDEVNDRRCEGTQVDR